MLHFDNDPNFTYTHNRSRVINRGLNSWGVHAWRVNLKVFGSSWPGLVHEILAITSPSSLKSSDGFNAVYSHKFLTEEWFVSRGRDGHTQVHGAITRVWDFTTAARRRVRVHVTECHHNLICILIQLLCKIIQQFRPSQSKLIVLWRKDAKQKSCKCVHFVIQTWIMVCISAVNVSTWFVNKNLIAANHLVEGSLSIRIPDKHCLDQVWTPVLYSQQPSLRLYE